MEGKHGSIAPNPAVLRCRRHAGGGWQCSSRRVKAIEPASHSDPSALLMPFAGPIPDSAQVPDTRRQQFELQQEVAHLQRQASALNHPDTFAQVRPASWLAESGFIW